MGIQQSTPPTYYAHRATQGHFELRQARYRERFTAGREHKHDVCAVASIKRASHSTASARPGAKASADGSATAASSVGCARRHSRRSTVDPA